MDSDHSHTTESIEQAKHRIAALVQEIAALAKREGDEDKFFEDVLNRVVAAMSAVGGAVWLYDDNGDLRLSKQLNLSESALESPGDDQSRHRNLLLHTMAEGRATVVKPYSSIEGSEEKGNPTSYLLVVAPIACHGRFMGALEIFQRPVTDADVQHGFMRFVRQMADVVGRWLQTRGSQTLADPASLWARSDAFSRAVHDSLNVRETAYAMANEGRRLIECDRVSVAICRGEKCKIEAVSGQDVLDKRANSVRLLEMLATRVVKGRDPFWFSGEFDDVPPPIEDACEQYIDETLTKSIAVIPLCGPPKSHATGKRNDDELQSEPTPGDPIGVVIIEQIEKSQPWAKLAPRINIVEEHGSRALARAVEHNDVFLMPVWRRLSKTRDLLKPKYRSKTITIATIILIALLAITVVPIDFPLKSEGVLQPKDRSEIFVEVPGVVTKVHVEHGDDVEAGDPLVSLRNIDLQVERTKVDGDLLETQNQLDALRKSLLRDAPLVGAERTKAAAEIGRLQKKRDNLARQLELIDDQISKLIITAPIPGKVITWHVQEILPDRPVETGEILMTIANPDGEWELELYMPESRIGHVAKAADERDEPLPVEYAVGSDPSRSYEGTVRDFHAVSEMHEEEGQSVRIRVDVDEQDLTDPRPGTSVKAKVVCGKACIAYVYGHEVWEFVQRHILF